MYPDVRAYLVQRGVDPSPHQQRMVSAELSRASDFVSAMSTDHQAFLLDTFPYRAPLFNEICHGRSEPLLDVWEAIERDRFEVSQATRLNRGIGVYFGWRSAAYTDVAR
jgi:protein-tyrosine-phosphatase